MNPLDCAEMVISPSRYKIKLGWQEGSVSLSQVYLGGKMCEKALDLMLSTDHDIRNVQPRIAKAFQNLVQNTVKHDGNIITIHFTIKEHKDISTIICEADDAGIRVDIKKRLFTHAVGKDHGIGLFLSRKILSIIGITIDETSEPGHGARSIMTVSPSGIRRPKERRS